MLNGKVVSPEQLELEVRKLYSYPGGAGLRIVVNTSNGGPLRIFSLGSWQRACAFANRLFDGRRGGEAVRVAITDQIPVRHRGQKGTSRWEILQVKPRGWKPKRRKQSV